MNIHKHMEAIFVVTLAAVGAGKLAYDSLPQATAAGAAPTARQAAVADARAIVVRAPTLPRHA
jgi:hypothetical protein